MSELTRHLNTVMKVIKKTSVDEEPVFYFKAGLLRG